jgi:type IV pilus assembly protein PilB
VAIRLGELLLKEKMLTPQQLQETLEYQRQSGESLWRALVRRGFATDKELTGLLSREYAVPSVDLDRYEVDPVIANVIPAETARKYQLLPLFRSGATLTVAMADPMNVFAMEKIRSMTGCDVQPVVTSEPELQERMDRYYGSASSARPEPDRPRRSAVPETDKTPTPAVAHVDPVPAAIGGIRSLSEIDPASLATEPTPEMMVQLTNLILADSLRQRATDIHVEPYENEVRVRFRVDGVLHYALALPARMNDPLTSRIKAMCNGNVADGRRPQTGTIRTRTQLEERSRELEFHVWCLPTQWGERITLKRIDRSGFIPASELGFEPSSLERLQHVLKSPTGMVLLTGPRGSGLTSTFYSALISINEPSRSIMTLEDRIEVDIPGISQVPMPDEKVLAPAEAIPWLVSQDADVVGLSSLRHREMFEPAVLAAFDSLVLWCLRGANAASTLVGLRDERGSKILPLTFAKVLRAVVAQRLVRRICESCKTEDHSSSLALADIGFSPEEVSTFPVFKGKGCPACHGTGYKGRTGLYEVLEVTSSIGDLLASGASSSEIVIMALEQGMRSLRMAGLEKIRSGITTVEEVTRETELSPR